MQEIDSGKQRRSRYIKCVFVYGAAAVVVLVVHLSTNGNLGFHTDELYYMTPDTNGSPIEVLAETSPSKKFQRPHPSVCIVKHPTARIVGIALGPHHRVTADAASARSSLAQAMYASGRTRTTAGRPGAAVWHRTA